LTGTMHYFNSLYSISSLPPTTSSAMSASSSSLSPVPLVRSSSLSPLASFLSHLHHYHNLFSACCLSCDHLLHYHDDRVKFIPPVIRTIGQGAALHIGCYTAWKIKIPTSRLRPHILQGHPNTAQTGHPTTASASSSTAASASSTAAAAQTSAHS